MTKTAYKRKLIRTYRSKRITSMMEEWSDVKRNRKLRAYMLNCKHKKKERKPEVGEALSIQSLPTMKNARMDVQHLPKHHHHWESRSQILVPMRVIII